MTRVFVSIAFYFSDDEVSFEIFPIQKDMGNDKASERGRRAEIVSDKRF